LRIAVAGASGFIGRNLIKALADSGHEVAALYNSRSPSQPFPDAISWLKANIHSVNELTAAFENVQVVYHLVGIIAETRQLTFEKTVVGGTANIIEAARRNSVGKIIYLSALGTSPDAPTKYFQAKWNAEEAVRKSGMEYVILRPSVIFGPEDKFINTLARLIKFSPIVPIIGNGRQMLQPIFVRDLTSIMISALENSRAAYKTIEFGGPEKLEFRRLVEIIKNVLNKERVNFYIPNWLAVLMAGILENIMKPSPLTRDQLKMLEIGNVVDNSRMLEIFGLNLTKVEDGLRIYLR
jgi:NADH dehydrogenase